MRPAPASSSSTTPQQQQPPPPATKSFQSARLPTSAPTLVFLGIDDRPAAAAHHPTSPEDATPAKVDPKSPQGVPYFAIAVPAPAPPPQEQGTAEEEKSENTAFLPGLKRAHEFVEPRLAGSVLDPWQANIFAEARAMIGTS
ncbi:hypothetical protein QFC22_004315 [Naganishia vaughanmartiniae]|uniref:Uncharacterized protein n=1 Tax=Naganishia vaughanmartiniae TaxID=1424756 RepID=A0ACC2X269_9TREE|nr:hypothetical protein QFC22_004315 [Naganishia vaughanmartiniae]